MAVPGEVHVLSAIVAAEEAMDVTLRLNSWSQY